MIQIVKRWEVNVQFADGTEIKVWIDANHYQEVLRKVADLGFSKDGLRVPVTVFVAATVPDGADACAQKLANLTSSVEQLERCVRPNHGV